MVTNAQLTMTCMLAGCPSAEVKDQWFAEYVLLKKEERVILSNCFMWCTRKNLTTCQQDVFATGL
jgi:hypothetical protein